MYWITSGACGDADCIGMLIFLSLDDDCVCDLCYCALACPLSLLWSSVVCNIVKCGP